jgi:hypothetical protein
MIFNLQRENLLTPRSHLRAARERSSVREHEGIIKIECLLVKSMDERKIIEVARSSVEIATFRALLI